MEKHGSYPYSVNRLLGEIRRLNELVDQLRALTDGLVVNDAHLPAFESWPQIPNGEAIADLTESEALQGREAPSGCEPDAPGDGLDAIIGRGA